ncbi:UDP-N-acetylmuramoyl-tripeptide--D-alanyl-D-alanine ligase [Actinoplanes sp. SE50]|uniref:UDP-N-acetylmuramoyl-tripeptide--D-alanyl-D- alanine ligase n=1 Tax=unclassified Actinoplanes TaxID=2626549 RepID=UPI00023ECC46|nr:MULTISPECIES: UDP-N-acetylmuramoyl-tripeptide--D-alanyl-D-alanine ligase [unclassified Actinoplanes]AEV82655.1 UDP-N-acetylmuramoylalanyl-D-glutamyl-2, 6-diaminopimelate- -D-alanyl-D-alanine ligase [Actinoplanes sp. SE50/110]ATO81051.1 UDP-N-acetylmuramoyl-tripeptide--D-alanyl-D-alanine ligase [Actinoplanes sp. SE50]SLL98458.1 UDP-N-acetylmuramoyl-tripeptide--D-alanyl-D-alanine ligase [Actinoplanes sp. SE50/110]
MIPMTLAEIAAVTGGHLVNSDGSETVTGGVEYDSRRVGPGGLFVAFAGEKADGHDFGPKVVAAGAAGVLGTRDAGAPGVVVEDQLAALAKLAHEVLTRLPELTVVGLTGSSGKTTTKDYLGQLLSRLGPTVAPAGSLNNELGFPYTVLQAGRETRFLVLEMGARGIGHIRYLTGIARPSIGLVLNVGAAHLGEFGSIEGTARAKGELVEALPADGVAVLNADDPLVAAMASRTGARVLRVGEAADADLRATGVTVDSAGRASYVLHHGLEVRNVRLGVAGRHQVANSLAAAAAALTAGMPLDDLATALGEVGIVSGRRMDVIERPDGVTVVDDSYNANPSSTAAALHALAAMGAGKRTTAVLGYMAELGEHEVSGHAEVGRLAAELGVDRLIAVADNARPILDGAAAAPGWRGTALFAADQAAAIEILQSDLRADDVVLVKGSRYRTWDVADWLRRPEEVQPT